jgi:hypothetical protein
MKNQTTAEIVQQFSEFVIELRAQQNAGLPGFDGGNIAVIIGRQAQHLSEGYMHENAFGLLMHAAKLTLGFRMAAEAGELLEADCQQRIDVAVKEVAKHLDE